MRVGFFLPDFNGGGAERAALTLASQWPDEAGQALLIARCDSGVFVEEARALGAIFLGINAHGLRATLRTPRRLADVVDAYDLDVVVTFLSVPSVLAAKRYARDLKVVLS